MTKRLIFICFFISLCICLMGCTNTKVTHNNNITRSLESSSIAPEEHSNSTSDVSSDEISESSDENKWKVKYYVDEFDDPTDEKYIGYIGEGTFSNTATTDSTLVFSVLCDSAVYIKLYEYGNSLVKNPYSHSVEYTVRIKEENGLKSEYEGTMYSDSGDRIKIYGLTSKFRSNKTLKFHIINNDTPTTTYDFTIDASGFNEAYEEFINK